MRRSTDHVGPATEIRALRGGSFVARHGESIGFVGRNKLDQSTLLRATGQTSLLGVNAALMKGLTVERTSRSASLPSV